MPAYTICLPFSLPPPLSPFLPTFSHPPLPFPCLHIFMGLLLCHAILNSVFLYMTWLPAANLTYPTSIYVVIGLLLGRQEQFGDGRWCGGGFVCLWWLFCVVVPFCAKTSIVAFAMQCHACPAPCHNHVCLFSQMLYHHLSILSHQIYSHHLGKNILSLSYKCHLCLVIVYLCLGRHARFLARQEQT